MRTHSARFAASVAALFVSLICLGAGAARAEAEQTVTPAVAPPPAPATAAFTGQVAAAKPGDVLTIPSADYPDYRVPPEGLRPVNLPISVVYTSPGGEKRVIPFVKGDQAQLRPGLIFTVSGQATDGRTVAANLVVHHLDTVEMDVPVEGQVPQRQAVPYIRAWGPASFDVVNLKGRVVTITKPNAPTPTPTQPPGPAAGPTPPTPAQPGGLTAPDEQNPEPTANPALNQAQEIRALVVYLNAHSVGEVVQLPDWVLAAPSKAPPGWDRRLTLPGKYRLGQVVALVRRDSTGKATLWARAVVTGTGTERVGDTDREVAYLWAPYGGVPEAEGQRITVSNTVPPDCPAVAPVSR